MIDVAVKDNVMSRDGDTDVRRPTGAAMARGLATGARAAALQSDRFGSARNRLTLDVPSCPTGARRHRAEPKALAPKLHDAVATH